MDSRNPPESLPTPPAGDRAPGWLSERRLGSFEVKALLGAGGMGEVYRAVDLELRRDVALKILQDPLAQDPQERRRFEREARLLAALNHPSIATIFGIQEDAGVRFFVMELVPGETLAELLRRGPLPVGQTGEIFEQIAQALEAAHAKGILHGDLKPQNIKLTPEGKVKLLDFGLARALAPPGDSPAQDSTQSLSANTSPGIAGTPPYMSPEQLRGETPDARADIWAFGCCLYEALTGSRAFAGPSHAVTVSLILSAEPDWTRLPADLPPAVSALVRRCLRRGLPDRIHSAADARIALEDAGAPALPAPAPVPGSRRSWRPWAVAALLAAALVSILLWSGRSSPPAAPQRFAIALPEGVRLDGFGNSLALSRDGRRLVFAGRKGDTRRLYVKKSDEFEARELPGTEGASDPFFSPDGAWVGFTQNEKALLKISLEGGSPNLISSEVGFCASWTPAGTILAGSRMGGGIYEIPQNGGKARAVTTPERHFEKGEDFHLCPQSLPGGKAILFSTWAGPEQMRVAVLNLETGRRTTLLDPGGLATYLPTGHIVYVRAARGEAFIVPFDAAGLRLRGEPRLLAGQVQTDWYGGADLAAASDGTLVFARGGMIKVAHRLSWVDHSGRVEPIEVPPASCTQVRVAPDGRRIAFCRPKDHVGIMQSLWVYDLGRKTLTPLTDERGSETWPVWTPDSRRIAFNSTMEGPVYNLYWKLADGSQTEERLTRGPFNQQAQSWTRDGKTLIYQEGPHPDTGMDILALDPAGDRTPRALAKTSASEIHASLSPDDRWLAFASDASGRFEVYLQPYPGPGPVTQVSVKGGVEPVWAPNGRELYYRDESGHRVFAVAVQDFPKGPLGSPRLALEGKYVPFQPWGRSYDLSPDGRRFLMIEEADTQPDVRTLLVLSPGAR